MDNLISVYLETTGLDPNKHQILSIGAVNPSDYGEFYQEISHNDLVVNKLAGKMNKDLLFNDGIKMIKALGKFMTWVAQYYETKYWKNLIIIGKQPAFDRSFLKTAWGQFVDFPFSHRCLDINSILLYNALRQGTTFEDERMALEEAVKNRMTIKEHNALHDARWNVYAYEELIEKGWVENV